MMLMKALSDEIDIFMSDHWNGGYELAIAFIKDSNEC